ncbi:type VI secretion system-associated FHA domain protein TagH [Rhizobium halophytocola]|uniref:Type VI secretion system FHA domain protein n=1 Tax=Rhizobium halophytocola TaxID=735519 RepID=A0ABS4E3J8_9HYPH|nr:type VI secretion system-associated FHA domain protein TagH [Rhizobium halophytocola]MBP1852493.1 type VI secretion system FHA domain protein [Rhizobium halophytocola]
MSLVLRMVNSGTLPGGRTVIPMVNGALTVGRGEENDLALPDPDRQLSKRHCVFEERNGDYVIVDVSTNGTFLNYGAERLGNIPTPLNHGDVIQLGSFELVVEIDTGAPDPRVAQPLPPAADTLASPDRPLTGLDPAELSDPLSGPGEPWDDFLGELPGASTQQTEQALWNNPGIPADPLAGDPLAAAPSAGDPFAADAFAADPFAPDPFAGEPLAPGLDFDDMPLASSGGASVSDHTPTAQDHFSAPSVQSSAIPDDWDDLFKPTTPDPVPMPTEPVAATPAPPVAAAPQPQPAQPAPFEPLEPLDPLEPAEDLAPARPAPAPIIAAPQPPAPVQPVAPVPSAAAPGGQLDAAARAFFAAAGVGHLDVPAAELEETMARMGRVFAAMITGMREILMTRASIKSEMRMNRTMITSGGNNPLKFSISPEQAIEAMIRPSVRGYLDAETAAAQALTDIRAHEVAMMTGMEAALKNLLKRLGPDQLSARIESGSTLGGLLGGKKARYWEAYEKMYAQIAKETEDDFQSNFGREFARAYEEQLQKL